MKALVYIKIVLLSLVFSSFTSEINPPVDDLEIGNRGASSKEALAEVVYASIKMNDFNLLQNYIPNDNELLYLKNHTSRKNRYMYEGLTAELIEGNTQLNFEKVVQAGIKNEVNWSSIEITDSKVEEAKMNDKRLYVGTFTVQDSKVKTMKISFDIVKIKEKYFLFQGIRTDNNKTASEF
jgi:hypothetical protein